MHAPAWIASIACATTLLASALAPQLSSEPSAQKRPASTPDTKSKKKPPDTKKSIDGGLAWLARHQSEDGSWAGRNLVKRCSEHPCFEPELTHDDFDTGITALALIAFLRTGHLPGSTTELVDPLTKKSFQPGEIVLRGLESLRKQQVPSGEFARSARKFVYDEALAELAMVEAFSRTQDAKWKDCAQRGANALAKAQRVNPSGAGAWGWYYVPRADVPAAEVSQSDTSATGWCVVALSAARSAGLDVNKDVFQGALDYVDSVSLPNGLAGYVAKKEAGMKVMGPHDEFDYHCGTMSALAVLIRLESGTGSTNAFFAAAAQQIQKDLPAVSPDKLSVDYYYWYQGSSALNRLDEVQPKKTKAKKKYAEAWNRALVEAVCAVQDQAADRCSLGGWVVSDRWSFNGGPAYSTAMAVMALHAASPE